MRNIFEHLLALSIFTPEFLLNDVLKVHLSIGITDDIEVSCFVNHVLLRLIRSWWHLHFLNTSVSVYDVESMHLSDFPRLGVFIHEIGVTL